MIGRIRAPKDIYDFIPRPSKYDSSNGKTIIADVIKVTDF